MTMHDNFFNDKVMFTKVHILVPNNIIFKREKVCDKVLKIVYYMIHPCFMNWVTFFFFFLIFYLMTFLSQLGLLK